MEDNTPADIINAVARIFGKFTKPSDDLSPVVFLRMPFEVIPVPILSSANEYMIELFGRRLPDLILRYKARSATHAYTAWELREDTPAEHRERALRHEFRVSESPYRTKRVLVVHVTAERIDAYRAPIIRPRDASPALGEFTLIDAGATAFRSHALTALQNALRRVVAR